ncbi:S8 family peptidase [Phycicoccus duodecadis]|uniref:Subtilase family protein n=1 Tax=Phycicoccus duodecadis TaxID=173053 RepID=A0A2N3YMG2_9MICO|nr:S8/S53 family peptidase [Phycicoccus duodecadis]PKW28050.1 subtilase family protein [Phycicoccus duodecadis]
MADGARKRLLGAVAACVAAGLLGAPSGAHAAPHAAAALGALPAAVAPLPGEWWWGAMGVDELHAAGTGRGMTVAVIDGPIEPDVPDLAGKVASSSTLCLDPTRSTDVLRSSTGRGPEAQHATSMAALIAGTGKGTGPGGRGIRGIAPDATIRHYAVLYDDPEDADRKACGVDFRTTDDVEKALGLSIARAARDGADVINLSLVTGFGQEIEDGLLTAYREGAIVVAGTGNGKGRVQWPGLGNGVVLVNPVGQDARTTDFSVTGDRAIGLAAPGEDVMAGADDGSGWRSTTVGSGASVATALVSGGIAALWSAHPQASAGQVLQAVRQNVGLRAKDDGSGYRTWFRRVGTGLPQVTAKNPAYGWGVFDPADAVEVDPTTLPTANPFVRTDDVVNGPSPEAIAAATAAASSTAASATPSASASPSPSPSPSTAAAPAVDDTPGGSGPGALVLLLVGAVVLVAGAAAFVLRGRARAVATTTADPATVGPPTDPGDLAVPTDDTAAHQSRGATSADGRKY